MKAKIEIEKNSFKRIERLPNSWNNDDFKELLEIVEYGGISELKETELEEMLLLALSENEPNEAAEIIMNYVFDKEELNSGQIQNMGNEMQSENAWEEYSGIELHKQFFKTGDLLYKAFGGGTFAHPEAIEFGLTLTFSTADALKEFKENETSSLLKVIALGLSDKAIINRLYHDQLKEEVVEEAKSILWETKLDASEAKKLQFTIISSEYWMDDFKYIDTFAVTYDTAANTFSL